MKKPTKDAVLVESDRLPENGECIRDDQWMTKEQLQRYADQIESEERIERGKRGRKKPRD